MTADVVAMDRERYHRAQEEAHKAARDDRIALTKNKEDVLGRLHPPLYDDNQTHKQVAEYLGITISTLYALVRTHSDELLEVGYAPSTGHAPARYSRRAVLHLAMMLRPSTSDMSTRIKKAMGVYAPPAVSRRNRWASHVTTCKNLVAKANHLAQDVQEIDPQEVWNDLSGMDRWQLQGLVVALGAMIPLDQEGLVHYLADLGANVPVAERTERADSRRAAGQQNVARGLASLIPITRAEYEETEL